VSAEIVARGGTLRQAFIQAALAMFALVVDPAAVEPREVREVRAHGMSLEALLVHWIGECGYVHEMEGFVCHTVDLTVFDVEPRVGGEPLRLHGFLHGEEMDPARHRPTATIKAVSSRVVSIRAIADGYEIRMTVEA